MLRGSLTRDDAIIVAGIDVVKKLDNENCDFSNRVIDDIYGIIEFVASLSFVDDAGDERSLIAYYYQDKEDVSAVETLDCLDWTIEGYEVY